MWKTVNIDYKILNSNVRIKIILAICVLAVLPVMAYGSNIYAVWSDSSSGNFEILLSKE